MGVRWLAQSVAVSKSKHCNVLGTPFEIHDNHHHLSSGGNVMSTDNRTNEQIVTDINRALTMEFAGPASRESAMRAALVEARRALLEAANRLALPPGEGAVVRAAKALCNAFPETFFWKAAMDYSRTVLTAGTAPQAESERLCREAGCWEEAYCEHSDPVQPSSTVDEGMVDRAVGAWFANLGKVGVNPMREALEAAIRGESRGE